MRVLLIEVIDENRESDIEILYPPLGLGYLAGYIRREASKRSEKGVEWDVRIVRGMTESERQTTVWEPDVVGLSFVTQNAMRAIEVVKRVREVTQAPIISGGHHVTAFPWWLSEQTGESIYSVMGEGERAFYEFCDMVSRGLISPHVCSTIDGLGYCEGGDYKMNSVSAPDFNFDRAIPHPAWDKFIYDRNEAHIFTSRGCPFRCVFCSSSFFWGKVRYHSPMRVYQEIRELVLRYRVDVINIYDDLFAVDKRRVRSIIKLIAHDSQLRDRGVRFSCLGRASVMDIEMAELLRDIGVASIAFGFESGSDRVLKYLKGAKASVESNYRAADIVRAAGIELVGSVMYGVPGETIEDVEKTLQMIKKMGLKTGEAYLATPYPGTALWRRAEKRGLVSDNMDFSRLRFDWGDDAVVVGELSLSELKDARVRFKENFKR